jgi:phosphopantetheinyl transferase (holo-ACP synthase)
MIAMNRGKFARCPAKIYAFTSVSVIYRVRHLVHSSQPSPLPDALPLPTSSTFQITTPFSSSSSSSSAKEVSVSSMQQQQQQQLKSEPILSDFYAKTISSFLLNSANFVVLKKASSSSGFDASHNCDDEKKLSSIIGVYPQEEEVEYIKSKETLWERQLNFLIGRMAIRVNAAMLGRSLPSAILRTDLGAPLIHANDKVVLYDDDDEGQGSKTLLVSLSHKNDHFVSAIKAVSGSSECLSIGVDIEEVNRGSSKNNYDYNSNNNNNNNSNANNRNKSTSASALARRVLTRNELSHLGRLGADVAAGIDEEVTLRFSMKEAVFKALNPLVKRYISFLEVEVWPKEDGSAVINFIDLKKESNKSNYLENYQESDYSSRIPPSNNSSSSSSSSSSSRKTSIYRGVSWNKRHKKWYANINIKGQYKYIGYFDDEVMAAKSYDAAIFENNLDENRLNFIDGVYQPWKINKSSKYRGVNWHKATNKWVAQITINNHQEYLGVFDDEIDAARAFDAAVIENNLDRARLNLNCRNIISDFSGYRVDGFWRRSGDFWISYVDVKRL